MATTTTHCVMSMVDSSGNINIIYPQNTGSDVSITPNTTVTSTTLQGMIDNFKTTVDSLITAKLPTVNNGTLTIQKNGTNVQTFTANQSANATANITVPTALTDLSGTLAVNKGGTGATTADNASANLGIYTRTYKCTIPGFLVPENPSDPTQYIGWRRLCKIKCNSGFGASGFIFTCGGWNYPGPTAATTAFNLRAFNTEVDAVVLNSRFMREHHESWYCDKGSIQKLRFVWNANGEYWLDAYLFFDRTVHGPMSDQYVFISGINITVTDIQNTNTIYTGSVSNPYEYSLYEPTIRWSEWYGRFRAGTSNSDWNSSTLWKNPFYKFDKQGLIIQQTRDESSGIQFNGDYINMWSPCDGYCIRYWDEDNNTEVWNIDASGKFSGYIDASHVTGGSGGGLYMHDISIYPNSQSQYVSAGGTHTTGNSYYVGWKRDRYGNVSRVTLADLGHSITSNTYSDISYHSFMIISSISTKITSLSTLCAVFRHGFSKYNSGSSLHWAGAGEILDVEPYAVIMHLYGRTNPSSILDGNYPDGGDYEFLYILNDSMIESISDTVSAF